MYAWVLLVVLCVVGGFAVYGNLTMDTEHDEILERIKRLGEQ